MRSKKFKARIFLQRKSLNISLDFVRSVKGNIRQNFAEANEQLKQFCQRRRIFK